VRCGGLARDIKGGTVRRGCLVLCGILVAASVVGLAYDTSQFLFLSDVRIGMRGIGKTVVAGDIISEFAAEVLGVIDEPGDQSDFIVVRVSGEAIGRSGGIAQGMSGSPVYVEGKLIGALSRAASWSKELTPIGLVTPIQEMLGILETVNGRPLAAGPAPEAVLAGVRVQEIDGPPAVGLLQAAPDTVFAYPVTTPLLVSGLSARALDVLMNGADSRSVPSGLLREFLPAGIGPSAHGLSSFGLSLLPVAGGAGKGGSSNAPALEAGSAIGVALVTGDLSIGALGTLTFREGDALIGFGHPFLSGGAEAFPLTTAHVYDTIKAYDASFKLGSLGDPVGVILEDGLAGIGGRVGQSAPLVTLSLGVLDLDRGKATNLTVELVDEPRIMWELLLASGFEAIDTALGRTGEGTVEVSYEILGDGMPFPLERHDLFLSTSDVALYPPWQLADIVSYLQYNPFQDPKITRVVASMRVTRELRAMQINHLELDRSDYALGDTIHYKVDLQDYRGRVQTQEGTLTIPFDLGYPDYVIVRAYGGPRAMEAGESAREFGDLGELIQAIEDTPSYDTLTVELFAPNPTSPRTDALMGVDETRTQLDGHFLYDERAATVYITYAG